MGGPIERRNVRRSLTVSTGSRGVITLAPMRASLFELADVCYHEASAVPLPEPAATPGQPPSALAFAAACFEHIANHPDEQSVVVAHAAPAGREAGNRALSADR